VEACKKETFDIIIMDIMMPEMDGFSAVNEIRKISDVNCTHENGHRQKVRIA
jgi:CheY-like chemotaxis protein